jgi:predicted nucleic acid-binding protein
MALSVFLDTSVLLAGLIDFGPQSAPAQSILHAVAEKTVPGPGTAWHCCLEFYSVATRADERAGLFAAAARDRIAGGRVYDAHIAEVARSAGAKIIVTDNRRHFLAALRHGIKVETPGEFLAAIKPRRT